jgi:alpha/beta superfamily hydrolase
MADGEVGRMEGKKGEICKKKMGVEIALHPHPQNRR